MPIAYSIRCLHYTDIFKITYEMDAWRTLAQRGVGLLRYSWNRFSASSRICAVASVPILVAPIWRYLST